MGIVEIGKVICDECGWKGTEKELLTADNPFDEDIGIIGCPSCRSINSISCVCDEKNCWKITTCGTPTDNGYRNTCGEHLPKEDI